MQTRTPDVAIYRILDANLNRLREALRVLEEYFRFLALNPARAIRLKKLRHDLLSIETALGRTNLLTSRHTSSDPFSKTVRAEELARASIRDLLAANLRRGQEAARCIEEYAKLLKNPDVFCIEQAKRVRFALYALEQKLLT